MAQSRPPEKSVASGVRSDGSRSVVMTMLQQTNDKEGEMRSEMVPVWKVQVAEFFQMKGVKSRPRQFPSHKQSILPWQQLPLLLRRAIQMSKIPVLSTSGS